MDSNLSNHVTFSGPRFHSALETRGVHILLARHPYSGRRSHGQPTRKRRTSPWEQRERCYTVAKAGWPLKAWAEMTLEHSASQLACRVHAGTAARSFLDEDFTVHSATGFMVERLWTFYTPTKFKQEFGVAPKNAGTQVQAITIDGKEQGGQEPTPPPRSDPSLTQTLIANHAALASKACQGLVKLFSGNAVGIVDDHALFVTSA